MTEPLFQKIDGLRIPVPDLDAGLAFYRDRLGHQLIWRTSSAAGLRMPITDAELVIHTEQEAAETDLLVDSADQAAARIVEAGGKVVVRSFDIPIGTCAVVEDPWRNRLVLVDLSKGVFVTDADGVVQTDARGNPIVKAPRHPGSAPLLPAGYSIRPIGREHIEGFHRCLDTVSRERRCLAFVEAPPLERVREFVESNIANGVAQFVAMFHDEVSGWCDVRPASKLPGFKHTGILGMGVHPDHRGRGLGRALLDRTVEGANRAGMKRVELEVYASNTPAISLYLRSGFVVEGRKRKARYLDGRYDDIILMARWIGADAG